MIITRRLKVCTHPSTPNYFYSFPSATNDRILKIPFSVKGSIANSGTIITAIVSPCHAW